MDQQQNLPAPPPPPLFIDPLNKENELKRWDAHAPRVIQLWRMRNSGPEWKIAYETALERRETILSETQKEIAQRRWNRIRGLVFSGEFMPEWQMEALMTLQELRNN